MSNPKFEAIPAKKLTRIFIGNHIVNARYNYSLIQVRILISILKDLQEHIKKVKDLHCTVNQLDLFKGCLDNVVVMKVKLKDISPPDEYDHVRETMKKMCGIVIETEVKDNNLKTWRQWQGLFLKVNQPEDLQRSNYMVVTMDIQVAEQLVYINRGTNRQTREPQSDNYSSFYFEPAMSTKNKYTPRIYMLLSRFKDQGGVYYSIDDLRDLLVLDTRYKDVEAIKRRILLPVQEELKRSADIWYNVKEKGFEKKDGKKVLGFNFKIVNEESGKLYNEQLNNLLHTLRVDFKMDNDGIKSLRYIIDDAGNWPDLMACLDRVQYKLREDRSIKNHGGYTRNAIANAFKSEPQGR